MNENSRKGTAVGSPQTATDPDEGDVVTYSVDTDAYFTVDQKGQLSVSGKGALDHEAEGGDTHMVTVMASDKYDGVAYLDVTVEVADVNEGPTLDEAISDQAVLVGVTTDPCIDTTKHFSDVDEHDQRAGLLVDASIKKRSVATVNIDDNQSVCITGVSAGTSIVTVTATDRDGKSVKDRFEVMVAENKAPTVAAAIGSLTIQEGGRSRDISLYDVFDDGDATAEETLIFEVTVEDEFTATGALVGDDGDQLRVYGDAKGETVVTVTATDQNDQSVDDVISLVVERNDPPMAGLVADIKTRVGLNSEQKARADQDPDEVTLDGAFTDEGDNFIMVAETDNPDIATAAVVQMPDGSSILRVHPHSAGVTTGTVVATDSIDNTATVTFEIQVDPQNDSPEVNEAPADLQVVEVHNSLVIPLENVFSDPDEDVLELKVVNEDETIADVVYRETVNELRVYGNLSGTTMVSITATDNMLYNAMPSVEFTVLANDKPIVDQAVKDQEVIADISSTIDLADVFMDPDGTVDALTLTVSSSDDSIVAVLLDDFTLNVDPRDIGTVTITVTAMDIYGSTATDEFELTSINLPPQVAMPIDDQELVLNHAPDIVGLIDKFMDGNLPENEMLTYTQESSDPEIAELTIDGGELTIDAQSLGTTTVTVTATDKYGDSASSNFDVTVINLEPKLDEPIGDKSVTIAIDAEPVSLEGRFSDGNLADDEMLTYSVTSSDDGIATATLADDMLTLTGISKGAVTITVTATDQYGDSATDTFELTSENLVPMVADPIGDKSVTIAIDAPPVSLEGVFSDGNLADDEMLTYSVTSSDDGIATATLSEGMLTLAGISKGVVTIAVTATDKHGDSATDEFELTAKNDPPSVAMEIEDQELVLNHEPVVIDLLDKFEDPNLSLNEMLVFSSSSSDESIASAMVDGMELTVSAHALGEAIVTVTATDKHGDSVPTDFVVSVINLKPIVANPIDPQSVTIAIDAEPVALEGVFSDGNLAPDETLMYEVVSTDDAIATATLTEDMQMITLAGHSPGEATVTVTATDRHGDSASTDFLVTSINLAPMVVNPIDPQTVTIAFPLDVPLEGVFSDGNLAPDETLMYGVESDDDSVATAMVTDDMLAITLTGHTPGEATVTVTATDRHGDSASTDFLVTSINLAPIVVDPIGPQSVTIAFPEEVSLSGVFSDPNPLPGETLEYSVESANDAIASAMLSGDMLTLTGVLPGKVMIHVTATDMFGDSATDSFELTVVNLAPIVAMEIANQVVTVGTPLTVSVTGVFSDPNARPGDVLTLSTASADASLATVSLAGETLTIDGHNPGTVAITVTATDVFGASVDESFDVKVETMPEAVGTIATVNLQVGGEPHQIDLSQYFIDRDGEPMTYTATVSGTAAVVSISGANSHGIGILERVGQRDGDRH